MQWEPNNSNAEESLLGAIVRGGANEKIFDQIKPEHFYNKTIKLYYEAALDAHKCGELVDYTTVVSRLSDRNFTELGQLIKDTVGSANIYAYAKIIKDKAIERESITKFNEAIELIRRGGSTQDNISNSLALINTINIQESKQHAKHVKDIASEWLDIYDDRINNRIESGLKTGVTMLDEIYGSRGVGDTDLVVIGGRSKMGKTALATMICCEMALQEKNTLIFSMEMPILQMFERLLSQQSMVSGSKFHEIMPDSELAKVSKAVGDFMNSKLFIDDRSSLSLSQIRSACRKHEDDHGKLGAIFVDYFTMMKIEKAERNDLAHGANSTGLKNLAKELKSPIFLLSQLNRRVDSRSNKRPYISDLRESGSLEQDADSIIFLYKDSVYNPDNGTGGLTEVILAANRHGSAGTAFVDMKEGYFVNLEQNQVNERLGQHRNNDNRKYKRD
jgi:replicative DNA helicase